VKEEGAFCTSPRWIDTDVANLTARITDMPVRSDIDLPIEEHLIVELYSK
jgi:small subunit ribosomal protein S4